MEGEEFGSARVMEEGQLVGLRERTTDYARRVIRLYRSLPKEAVAQTLGRQLLRSGTSVGANYREAARGRSTPEFIAKVGDSLRELDESAYWLELLSEDPALPAARFAPLRDETEELIAIFVTVLPNAKGRQKAEGRRQKAKGRRTDLGKTSIPKTLTFCLQMIARPLFPVHNLLLVRDR